MMSSPSNSPGVVLKTRFTISGKEAFQNYIDYVDREDATKKAEESQKMFSLYQDYMGNPDKTSSLFTNWSDELSKADKGKVKSLFQEAQEKGSVMWQDVLSFNNEWLEEKGVYHSKTKELDENKMKDVARKAMQTMQEKEGLSKSAVWSGAIHYNTDNIHIHLAMVEPNPTRERGKRKPKTLEKMKSTVVNEISNRQPEQQRINDMIRKQMVQQKQLNSTFKWKNRDLKQPFMEIVAQLPKDKKQWQYNYQTLNPVRHKLDRLTEAYLEKHHGQDLKSLDKMLDKEVSEMKKAYGEGGSDKKRYEHYKETKKKDLYTRMGNGFLKEMKHYATEKERIERMANRPQKWKQAKQNLQGLHAIKRASFHMGRDYENWKDQREYDKLQRDIERTTQERN